MFTDKVVETSGLDSKFNFQQKVTYDIFFLIDSKYFFLHLKFKNVFSIFWPFNDNNYLNLMTKIKCEYTIGKYIKFPIFWAQHNIFLVKN